MPKPRIFKHDPRFVIVEWPPQLDVDDVSEHFQEVVAVLESSEAPRICVVDLTDARGMDALVRKKTAAALDDLVARAASRVRGIVYVAPTAPARGALTAIHWLTSVPFPNAVVDTRAEALRWAETVSPS
jgi:hypothetical protein